MLVLFCIGALILLLGTTATGLFAQLRALSVAGGDNKQWSISQLDTEFANLSATLSNRLGGGDDLSDSDLRLRLDIALSRIEVINSGRAASLFAESEAAPALIAPVNTYRAQAIAISEQAGPLTEQSIMQLRDLTEVVRPNVRKLALLGLELSAVRTQKNRAEFLRQFTITGSIAITLLVLMAGLMLLLDRLLVQAARRDAALVTSSKHLQSTVAASLDAIVTSNAQGEIIDFNAAAETVFGWPRDEVIGLKMEHTIIPPKMRKAHKAGMARYLETGTPRVVDGGRVELVALRNSGEEFPVELNITSINDHGDTRFVAYLRDISEQKINEQKLIDARDRAERTDQAKSHFLTVMSHEMRTPLNGILGVLDLLKTTNLTAKQQRYTQIATASGEILLEHINEALDLTRIETGSLKLTPHVFDLAELVTAVADVLQPLAHEKDLAFSTHIDDAMRMEFYADSKRIRQILTNLIGNAVKFTDKGGIGLKVEGIHGPAISSLKFAVSDTGAGIAARHQEQIFEDFVALTHSEGRQSRGDGLGLAISRKIAREMGGDITVTSERGVGSTFVLRMPLERREKLVPLEATTNGSAHGANAHLDILVVEDNVINRKVLSDMLQGMGHSVTEAADGLECLKLAETRRFDLIFMDISMPNMDGIEATKRLRKGSGTNAETQIIGLTAHGHDEYRDASQRAGMDSFQTKPIRISTLQTVLNKASGARPVPIPTEDAPSALIELCDALGPQKVEDVGMQFFAELSTFFDHVETGTLCPNTVETAEVVHKLKGAAALLGQTSLLLPLAALEADTRAQAAEDLTSRKDLLKQLAPGAKQEFHSTIQRHAS